VKTLAELQAACDALGIKVETDGRPSKEPYVIALRDYHWNKDHPNEPLPRQVSPMLLSDWADLTPDQAQEIEQDNHAWIIQPKLDGVRSLLHIEAGQVRITSRYIGETTFRLSEFQDNLLHLTQGLQGLAGTILDGELVCPINAIDTGTTSTATALQAVVAILSTTPEKARRIQERHQARLQFHAFDVLQFRGTVVTELSLLDRLDFLAKAVREADIPHLEMVPSFVIGKASIHHNILAAGGEGSCWKKLSEPYRTGARVKHWIKRKAAIELEAVAIGFKAGNNGHAHLVGAVEFGTRQADGSVVPIAWVSGWSDQERQAMTGVCSAGKAVLNPSYFGRKALIQGLDHSAKSRRIRHAKIVRWLD